LKRGPEATRSATSVELIERDVEAPEVFEAEDRALWDGRPSLGGVWVAAPGVRDPERVIIRNVENGKFVIGALFKREEGNPGPRLQLSSDAAAALGVLAGRPASVSVVALRREEVADPQPAPETEAPSTDAGEPPASLPEEIVRTADAPAAPAKIETVPLAPSAIAEGSLAAAARASEIALGYVQVGIFSVEENAYNTAEAFRQAGVVPTIRREEGAGRPYWRVILGPSSTEADRSAVLRKAADLGFADAYPVAG
jgi:hypothetical protein